VQYTLGPDNATLTVRTGRTGAAAKAGHNLVIEVTAWTGRLTLDDADSSVDLSADPTSLRVLDGTGGIQSLGDDDKDNIRQTIITEVLEMDPIEFHSSSVSSAGDALKVDGELLLRGRRNKLSFELTAGDDGTLAGSARFKQTDWGMKPYSALFGTLKVTNEIEVAVEAQLHAPPNQ
jgi:polyisoprenoid-binding protein YceI